MGENNVKHNYLAEYKNIRIRPINERDLECLRKWRNDPLLSKYLRPIERITSIQQEKWYKEYLHDPDVIFFGIEEGESHKSLVGSVAIYDFNGNTAESGKIVIGNPLAKGKGIGCRAEALAIHIGFSCLGMTSFIRRVTVGNIPSLRISERLGFEKIKETSTAWGSREEIFHITDKDFYSKNPEYKDIICEE